MSRSDIINMSTFQKTVTAEGHLIDSGLMRQIFDTIIADGGQYEILDFQIGRSNEQPSLAKLKISADETAALDIIMLKLSSLGCVVDRDREAVLKPSPKDGVVPPDFYSSTNHETFIHHHNEWLKVQNLRMDCAIVVNDASATVKKFRDVKKDEMIAVGLEGIKVVPDFVERSRADFAFMSGEISTERKVRLVVDKVAEIIGSRKKRLAVVSGPVLIHTGGSNGLIKLIENGYIQLLLAGNALAVHDIEAALYGTSLGIDLSSGKPVEMGHRNHLRAINEVRRAGSIPNLVKEGTLTSGIMNAIVKAGIPFSLAGSLRDDGPLPETITDMNAAQDEHFRLLQGVDIVLMLSSMLHSIAVGNMIPARVLTICVDINPSVVTKLKDRGSLQTIGVVTDVGLFVHMLAEKLTGRIA